VDELQRSLSGSVIRRAFDKTLEDLAEVAKDITAYNIRM
jgi:hypothetical protein